MKQETRSNETSRSEDDATGEEIHFINPLVENSSNELISEQTVKNSELIRTKHLKSSSIHQWKEAVAKFSQIFKRM